MTSVYPRAHASLEKHDYPTYKFGNRGHILSDIDRHAVQWHETFTLWHRHAPFLPKIILCRSIPSNNVLVSSTEISDIIMFIQWCSNVRVCVRHINITQEWLSHVQNWSEVRLYAYSTYRSSTIHNLRLVWDLGPSVVLASMLAWKPHDPSTVYHGMLKTVGPGLTSVHAIHNSIVPSTTLWNTLQHPTTPYNTGGGDLTSHGWVSYGQDIEWGYSPRPGTWIFRSWLLPQSAWGNSHQVDGWRLETDPL